MQHKQRFSELHTFLKTHQEIWIDEILNRYPHSTYCFPESWQEEMRSLSEDELYRLEDLKDLTVLKNPKNKKFIEEIIYHSRVERDIRKVIALPQVIRNRIKVKKKHEIECLLPHLLEDLQQHKIDSLTDIGGGIGYLAHCLLHHKELPIKLIDRDLDLQAKGKKRVEKFFPQFGTHLEYLNHEIIEEQQLEGLCLGLHSCGNLSPLLLKSVVESKAPGVINLGCCYFKMCPDPQTHLSKWAQDHPLPLTKEALSLATIAVWSQGRQQFEIKQRVKMYRYTMLRLLYLEYGVEQFIPFGSFKPRFYTQWSFSEYAQNVLERLGKKPLSSPQAMDHFFEKNFDEIQIFIRLNIIRNFFARPLELAVLLDRVLFLEENNYNVFLGELFDLQNSPRNLGIKAYL